MKKLSLQIELCIVSVFFVGFLVYMGGCSGSLQSILNEYNSYYTPTKDPRVPLKPGEEGFNASEMLFPSYYTSEEGSVNLAAPESSSYKWALVDRDNNDLTSSLKFYDSCGPQQREFRFYLPLAYPALEVGTYKIILEVTDSEGNLYSDTALLVIYENLN